MLRFYASCPLFATSLILGSMVSNLSLRPILSKRLRIQGSTLRSQTADYKAEIIRRFATPRLTRCGMFTLHFRFGELLGNITSSDGDGPIRTYIHKARPIDRYIMTVYHSDHCELQVYPWTEIKEATQVMEADQNMFVNLSNFARFLLTRNRGKIVVEIV